MSCTNVSHQYLRSGAQTYVACGGRAGVNTAGAGRRRRF